METGPLRCPQSASQYRIDGKMHTLDRHLSTDVYLMYAFFHQCDTVKHSAGKEADQSPSNSSLPLSKT